jgi:hypothetical protein
LGIGTYFDRPTHDPRSTLQNRTPGDLRAGVGWRYFRMAAAVEGPSRVAVHAN